MQALGEGETRQNLLEDQPKQLGGLRWAHAFAMSLSRTRCGYLCPCPLPFRLQGTMGGGRFAHLCTPGGSSGWRWATPKEPLEGSRAGKMKWG